MSQISVWEKQMLILQRLQVLCQMANDVGCIDAITSFSCQLKELQVV